MFLVACLSHKLGKVLAGTLCLLVHCVCTSLGLSVGIARSCEATLTYMVHRPQGEEGHCPSTSSLSLYKLMSSSVSGLYDQSCDAESIIYYAIRVCPPKYLYFYSSHALQVGQSNQSGCPYIRYALQKYCCGFAILVILIHTFFCV